MWEDSIYILWTRRQQSILLVCVYKLTIQYFVKHTHTKLIKNNVNSKPKLLSTCNTMFRISRFRTTDIYCRTERLGQRLSIKIVFPNKLTMFTGILLKRFCYRYRLTMKMKTVSKRQYCSKPVNVGTKSRVYLSIACK